MGKHIFLCAGELSGDAYGAQLVTELKAIHPDWRFSGLGGPKMAAAGVDLLADVSHLSAVGLWESICVAPSLLSTYFKVKSYFKTAQIDAFIPIDFQGFNIPLLKIAKKQRVPSIYFVAPQHWQWGSEKAGAEIVDLTRSIITIFEKEDHFYSRLGADTCFIGHPLLDLVNNGRLDQDLRPFMEGDFDSNKPFMTIFPGSRRQEIHYIYPTLLNAGAKFFKEKGCQLVVSISDPRFKDHILRLTPSELQGRVIFYSGDSKPLIHQSQFSFAKSGTITLEHALLKTPCVVAYKLSALSYFIINSFFRHKLEQSLGFITLANFIMGEEMFPELIQGQATPENLLVCGRSLIGAQHSNINAQLDSFHDKLGSDGNGIKKAAQFISEQLKTN